MSTPNIVSLGFVSHDQQIKQSPNHFLQMNVCHRSAQQMRKSSFRWSDTVLELIERSYIWSNFCITSLAMEESLQDTQCPFWQDLKQVNWPTERIWGAQDSKFSQNTFLPPCCIPGSPRQSFKGASLLGHHWVECTRRQQIRQQIPQEVELQIFTCKL